MRPTLRLIRGGAGLPPPPVTDYVFTATVLNADAQPMTYAKFWRAMREMRGAPPFDILK